MSRNFELLQNLGKQQEIIVPGSTDSITAPITVAAVSAAPAPAAEKSGMEEINGVVQQIFLVPGTNAPRVVAFAGTERGSGCSWVCSHMGDMLATRIAGSVCLVDANLRDPSLHQQFGIENHRGMAEALLEPDPIRT